jgi:subtilisin family serine protease
MAKRKPVRTVLDGELSYLVRTAKTEATLRGDIPLDAVAAKRLALTADVSVEPGDRVTVKLVCKPGHQAGLVRWIEKHGGVITSQAEGGEVFLVDLPVTSIKNLNRSKDIQRAEAARVLLPRLDRARGDATGLDRALHHHQLTGKGVVFGIVDTGLDWSHPDFLDGEGNTRLELFTHAFVPPDSDVSRYNDYESGAINDSLRGEGPVPTGDPIGHGTHCASIAAGNGRGFEGTFRGVAHEAAIMAMRSEPLLDTHTIRGIREFFARAGDRPAVVSLSLGGHIGAHDGTSAIENVIAQESGPGRIVVVAAGNEGDAGIHWQGELVENGEISIPVRIADSNLQLVDVWIPRGDEVYIQIQPPDGSLYDPDGEVHATVFGRFLADWREDPVNRDQNLTLIVAGRPNFTWNINISADSVLHGEVHAWGHTTSSANASTLFPGFTKPGFSVGMPGTEERAIVVGSFVSKNQFKTKHGMLIADALREGQLSPFSSRGPTRIGKQKPDIAAPGQYITAALAQNSLYATGSSYTPRHHPADGYITIQGTSMATPFIAGVIAVMLEREPGLTPEDIQQKLRITARRDADTGRVWDPGFGYGKIDAEALLDYVS